jgi:hypothetical protein
MTYRSVPEQVAGGRTQVGKTAFKAMLAILSKRRGLATVIVTTTADLRNEIAKELQTRYFSKLPLISCPKCMSVNKPKGDERSRSQYDEDLLNCVSEYGVVVVNCSKSAINKISAKIQLLRGRNCPANFVLIKDESDTMDRTPERRLQLEIAMDLLTGKKGYDQSDGCKCFMTPPMLILNVSATLVPVFLRMKMEGKYQVESTFGEPDPNEYSGLENMEPIGGAFLLDRELRRSNEPIPYWCDKVQILYDDAHPFDAAQQKKGVLVLDAVNSRVTALDNIVDRARYLQKRYFRSTVMVVSGAVGIRVKFPDQPTWLYEDTLRSFVQDQFRSGRVSRGGTVLEAQEEQARASVSDVLTAIVCRQGVDSPIFVVGYSRMLRGESFRSSCVAPACPGGAPMCVVPTHMLCGLGERQSFENLVQMMGRATGTFKSSLAANGHQRVKLLTTWRDYDAAKAYLNFQTQLADRLRSMDLQQALGAIGATYAKEANFIDISRRALGHSKMCHHLEVQFEASSCGIGWQYAASLGMPSYGFRGQLFMLKSPLSTEQRELLTPEEHRVEDLLYHSKHLSDPTIIILRRVMMRLAIDDVWQSQGFWERQWERVPHLTYSKDGSPSVRFTNKRFSPENIRRGGMLRWRQTPGNGAGNLEYSLPESILRFHDEHRELIDRHPPAFTEEALRTAAGIIYPAVCGINSDRVHSPIDSRDAAGIGESGLKFSDIQLADVLKLVWKCKETVAAVKACSEADQSFAGIKCGKLNKAQLLERICATRPLGVKNPEELLHWLVQVPF